MRSLSTVSSVRIHQRSCQWQSSGLLWRLFAKLLTAMSLFETQQTLFRINNTTIPTMLSLATTQIGLLLRQAHYHQRLIIPPLYHAARSLSSHVAQPKNTRKQHIVVALGGNALLKRGEKLSVQNQRKNIADGLTSLKDVLKRNKITFVHGNGPQVGLLALQGAAYQKESGAEAMELDVLDAETEGKDF
jgi:hypothetical protein